MVTTLAGRRRVFRETGSHVRENCTQWSPTLCFATLHSASPRFTPCGVQLPHSFDGHHALIVADAAALEARLIPGMID